MRRANVALKGNLQIGLRDTSQTVTDLGRLQVFLCDVRPAGILCLMICFSFFQFLHLPYQRIGVSPNFSSVVEGDTVHPGRR